MKTKINSDIKRILTGAAVGTAVFFLFTMILALLLTKTDLSFTAVRLSCLAITAVSALIGGYTAKRKCKMKGIVCGTAVSGIQLLIILSLCFAINGFQSAGYLYLLAPACLLFGILGGIISSNIR